MELIKKPALKTYVLPSFTIYMCMILIHVINFMYENWIIKIFSLNIF